MRRKILNYIFTLILVFVLVFAAGSFSSCKKEPEKEPDHNTETDPKPTPTPTPDPKPVVVSKEYYLTDWYISIGKKIPQIKITSNDYSTVTFPIPEREHFTFNGWYIGEDKVADETGKSLMTEEIFNKDGDQIRAKWTAQESFNYKILLVFVTKIDAVLPVKDINSDDTYHVEYTMSDIHREFLHATTVNLKNMLDDMMDGLVNFQVDEYYTTQTVGVESMQLGEIPFADGAMRDVLLFPNRIEEISDMLDGYDACFSVTNLSPKVRSANIGGS